jgi:hypothetical protein
MRARPYALASLFALAASFGGCSCSPPTATPITLRAVNPLSLDLFVPDDTGLGGLSVLQGGALVSEGPPCACEACETICSGTCACDPQPTARKLVAGGKFERTFSGTSRAVTRADCGVGDLGPLCYQTGENLPAGTYTLRLCYASNVSATDKSQPTFPATFPDGTLTCVTKDFTYPDQTLVEISPTPPTPCSLANPCPTGQLCQRGLCSATCLLSGVPALSSTWTTNVSLIDNEAFFTVNEGATETTYTGAGTVGQVVYNGLDLQLQVNRTVGVGRATARFEVLLPTGTTPATFNQGDAVSIVLKKATAARENTAAVVVRDGLGNILLAADEGVGGPLLTALDLAPVAVNGENPLFACDPTQVCGKRNHRTVVFSTGTGATAAQVEVEPGKSGTLAVGAGALQAVVVANYKDDKTDTDHCGVEPVTSYVLVKTR